MAHGPEIVESEPLFSDSGALGLTYGENASERKGTLSHTDTPSGDVWSVVGRIHAHFSDPATLGLSLGGIFLQFGVCCQGRYLAIILHHLGYTLDEVGDTLGAGVLASIFAIPFFGMVSDHLQGPRLVLIVNSVLASIAYWVMMLPSKLEFAENLKTNHINGFLLWGIVFRMMLSFFFEPLLSIFMSLSMQLLGEGGFGISRVSMTVCVGLVSVFFGYLIDVFGPCIVLAGGFTVGLLLFGATMGKILEKTSAETVAYYNKLRKGLQNKKSAGDEANEDYIPCSKPDSSLSTTTATSATFSVDVIKNIILSEGPRSITFFLMIFALGACDGIVIGLVILFYKEDLHATNLQCGIMQLIGCVFQMPMFAYSKVLMQWMGPQNSVLAAAAAFVIRFLTYTFTTRVWQAFLLEPLQAPALVFTTLALAQYTTQIAPPGLEYTTGTLANTFSKLGSLTGLVFGGRLMASQSANTMFVITSTVIAIIMFIHITSLALTPSYYSKRKHDAEKDHPVVEGASTPVHINI